MNPILAILSLICLLLLRFLSLAEFSARSLHAALFLFVRAGAGIASGAAGRSAVWVCPWVHCAPVGLE